MRCDPPARPGQSQAMSDGLDDSWRSRHTEPDEHASRRPRGSHAHRPGQRAGRQAGVSAVVRVGFRRSGGLAGITIGADTDTSQLPAALGETVRALLPGRDSPPPGAPGGPDRFTYELRLDDGKRRRILRWPETAVPDEARPLIAELTTRSRPTP